MFKLPVPKFRPPKIILNAVEGFGKTTIGATSLDPSILMAGDETGYLTLLGAGRVPQVPAVVTDKWTDTLAAIKAVETKTIVLDALGGIERQCHRYVCANEYGSDWSKFLAYHTGYDRAVSEWLKFLSALERCGKMVILISHAKIKTFSDPLTNDYDRWIADSHHKTWAVTQRWADAVLFGNFRAIVDDDGRGIGGQDRVIYTEHRDGYDAKNRFGMPEEIKVSNEPLSVWGEIWQHIAPQAAPVATPEEVSA